MLKIIKWELVSNKQRNLIIEQVKQVIGDQDGYITHFQMFSDLAMMLTIEIEERRAQKLYEALARVVNLSTADELDFDAHATREITILLNLSFAQGTGNLKNEIPEVPG